MATETTIQKLYDNQRNVVYLLTGVSDGADETKVLKVNVADMSPVPVSVKIRHIEYNVSGGIVRLLWDADDPAIIMDLAGTNDIEWDMTAGMANTGGTSATGNILLSTIGFDVGSSYTIKLRMSKKNKF